MDDGKCGVSHQEGREMDNARLTALRAHMAEAGIDAYIVPTYSDSWSSAVGTM